MTEKQRRDAARLLRRLLEEVDAGRLAATNPQASRLARRLEGVVLALEAE